MKKILFLLLTVLTLGGCKGTEEPQPETAVASIATYVSTVDQVSTFTYTDNNDNLITLTAQWGGNKDLKAGQRVLIYYRAEAYGVSSEIVLLSVVTLPGGAPKYAAKADIPASVGLKQCSMWRSGNFLNLNAVVTFGGDAKAISLYIDEATKTQQTPTAYAVVESDYANLGVERNLYASWDLEEVFNAPDFEGLNIIFTNSSNQPQTIKITK